MKKLIRIAIALILTLSLPLSAALAEGIVSDTFNLQRVTSVGPRPTQAATAAPEATAEPEATPEPEATVEPTATPEPTVEPTATPEPTAAPQRKCFITSNIPADQIRVGDQVWLTANLIGYEGVQVEIAWERLVGDVWQPTGDTGVTVGFTVDESNLQGMWRFTVTVLSDAQPAAEEAGTVAP